MVRRISTVRVPYRLHYTLDFGCPTDQGPCILVAGFSLHVAVAPTTRIHPVIRPQRLTQPPVIGAITAWLKGPVIGRFTALLRWHRCDARWGPVFDNHMLQQCPPCTASHRTALQLQVAWERNV